MQSIRARLLAWILVFLIPLSCLAGWLLVEVFSASLLHDVDAALAEEAETVAEIAAKQPASDTLRALLDQIAGESDLGTQKYVIVDRDGQIIAAAPPEAPSMLRPQRPEWRIARHENDGGSLKVSVGVPVGSALHAKRRLTLLVVTGIPVALLIVALFISGILGSALRPLEAAAEAMESIDASDLSLRVPTARRDDEVARVIVVLNRMLERLQRAVTEIQQFTANAAHELRTPLAVLRAGLDVTLSQPRSAEEYRVALAEALRSGERLQRLADDLLTLSRLDCRDAPRNVMLVDLAEVLDELAEAWNASGAAQQPAAVRVRTTGSLQLLGNGADLYRLFSNLIDNAVRYSPAGTQVEVAANRDSTWITATVTDHGEGMPDTEVRHVFDRFYRGGTRNGAGSGLGLSIARQIVRTHGGSIELANAPDSGCIVTVRLPAEGPLLTLDAEGH